MGRSGSAIFFGNIVGDCSVKDEHDEFLASCNSKTCADLRSFGPGIFLARAFGGGEGT